MDAALVRLDRTLQRARTRLRLRAMVRTASVGLQVGLVAAIPVALLARAAGLDRPLAAVLAVVAAVVPMAVAAAVGWVWRGLDPRSLALLVDRLGATDELVLTALHVAGTEDPNRGPILARLEASRPPDIRELLPVRVPRHLRYAPVAVVLVVLAIAFVPPSLTLPWAQPPSPVAIEGRRIEERLTELPSGVQLPDAIQREVADLAEDLQGDELSAEEARARMEELMQQLATFEDTLQPSADLLDDLEKAAQALDASAVQNMAAALENADLEAAAAAAQDLSESLAEASPAERARAAEALAEAGKSLEKSQDPALQDIGKGLQSAGEQLSKPGGQEASAGTEASGSEPGTDAGLTPQQASDLAKQIDKARELGQQLQRDRKALERSQDLNGALKGSRQRLGGSPEVAQGSSSDSQQAGEGQGAGEGDSTSLSGSGPGVGSAGHTWEDQGEHRTPGNDGSDRLSDRTSGTHIDDFQKLYEGLRLQGAESLLAGVDGQIDERGRIDQLPIRITGGEEDATAPTVVLPAQYREQAAEAIDAEPVPPAYEQAVKQYFDAMP